MKAVLVDNNTQRLYIGDWADPVIGPDEILVDVKATALNRADLLQKAGKYPAPPGESTVLGMEMAGVVSKIGPAVSRWQEGDRVCALLPGGGYAERARVPERLAMAVPAGFTFEEAAAVPEVFLTAYLNLFLLGNLRSGQTAMFHAAGGGVGPAAIQLAKASGVRAIATVRSDEKAAACLRFGADVAVNTTTEDFAVLANQFTQNNGVNMILDPVGASYLAKNLDCLATDGRLVVIGLMGGYKVPDFDLRRLMLKRWQIIGSTLRALSVARKAEIVAGFTAGFLPMFSDGRLKPIIDSVWNVSDINEAHARMEKNLNIGKIVVTTAF